MNKLFTLLTRGMRWAFAMLLLGFPFLLQAQMVAMTEFNREHRREVESADRISLEDALRDLQKHYNISIVYEFDVVSGKQLDRPVAHHQKLGKTLTLLLEPFGLRFKKINEGTYAVSPSANIAQAPAKGRRTVDRQSGLLAYEVRLFEIAGRVTDENDQPLPGVNVIEKGTTNGTTTDGAGRFSLDVQNENSILVFSFIGYIPQEVAVGGRTDINVGMLPDVKALEEIVVVGYGAVKKSDLTGSVSSVKMEDLKNIPLTSIDQGLGGRAAGVMVTQTSGMPGAVASIRIRGSSSLQGGNEPLYVIDGFPIYSGGGFGNTGGSARMSGLSTINPSDIESIEILKDASATAIYGARAANGVVLITTKSGKKGRDVISFDAYYGVQNVVRKIDVMDAQQYAALVNEAFTNDGLPPLYDQGELEEIQKLGKGTDWQDEVFRPAPIQNYQLSFSGGDEKTVYSISTNYFNQQGVIINSDFKRYSARFNLERKLSKSFLTGTHLTLSKSFANIVRTDAGGESGVVTGAMKFSPILPVYENEAAGTYTLVHTPGVLIANPVATAKEQVRENQTFRVLGDIYSQWEIIPNLKAKVSLGVDVFNNRADFFTPSYIYESNGIATASIGNNMYYNWLNENTLNYSKQINENNFISLLGGITFQKNVSESFDASSQGFVNDVLQENNLGAGAVYNQPGSSSTEWSLVSYLGRANYNLGEKYLFSLNGRIDGSSRFGVNNKYAFFPSGAFAWRLGEEDFIQDIQAISNLKVRTSYGLTGNQEIGLYNSLPTLTNTIYTINRTLVTGFFPNTIPNPDLKWEKTAQFDVGIDLGLFNERLRLTSDYYYKKTTDLIYSVAVPFVSGFGFSLQNMGSIENRGVELGIESNNLTGRFQWNSHFNISFNRNKVLELGGESYKDIGSGDGHLKTGSVHRLIVGKPVGLFYGYKFDGIYQNQEELDAGPQSPTHWIGGRRYVDISGPAGQPDGFIDATYDRTVIGDPNPDFFGGLTNTFSFLGFELSAFMQFSYGNDLFNYNALELELPSGGQNAYAELINRWTPENPSNVYPKATTNRSAVFSDRFIEDGSYLKLKNVTFAYTFDASKIKHFSSLRLYLTGQNLLTFTNYRGYDPEVSFRGATNLEMGEDFGGYPQARTIMMGVKLDLK